MGGWRKDHETRRPFGRRTRLAHRNRGRQGGVSGHVPPNYGGTDWLDPAAYDALSREQKMALAERRRQDRFRRPRKRGGGRRPSGSWRYQAAVIVMTIGAVLAVGRLSQADLPLPNLNPKSAPVTAAFGDCHSGGGFNCVVDGDTFWLNGIDIRIADIDAPETHDYRCQEELALGNRASERLHELLESGPITLQPIDRDEDVYGRKLRLVYVSGRSVGERLIGEGLAHRYVRGKLPWCPNA